MIGCVNSNITKTQQVQHDDAALNTSLHLPHFNALALKANAVIYGPKSINENGYYTYKFHKDVQNLKAVLEKEMNIDDAALKDYYRQE